MKNNCFDTLYYYFTKNSKCSDKNHFGLPIYYCSENLCKKGYICSQCLTEDPEHFSNHVKYFIALDSKKNFFRFFDISIDNLDESYNNNFILNSRNKFFNFNREKINSVNSFYDYLKNQISVILINNQKNNLIKEENTFDEYYNKKKGIENKNSEFINKSIKDFIKINEKNKIVDLIKQIKPFLNKKNNEVTEKDKLNIINNLLSEEIAKLIEKCWTIFLKLENNDYTTDEINKTNENGNNEIEKENKEEENKEEKSKESNKETKENEKVEENLNNEKNKLKTNKIIKVINDIKPMKKDIKILNIELNNNIFDNNKSFYEGSINNISSIKTENLLEAEEYESKININLNSIEINKQNKNSNINKNPSINDSFFNNKELSNLEKEKENKFFCENLFNDYKKREKSLRIINNLNSNNNGKENSFINNQFLKQDNNPTIAAPNNIQISNDSNKDIMNELEIKLNKIQNKKSKNNHNKIGNNLKINDDKIIKESNQFIIDIKKNNFGNHHMNSPKSSINISIGQYKKNNNNIYNINNNIYNNNNLYFNDSEKTKENLNRLDKIRDKIGKLLK